MTGFISPVADDAVTKLQNLLQNTLYSFADITITYAPDKSREFTNECKELGITLPDGMNDPVVSAESIEDSGMNGSCKLSPGSLMDRVERLGELNDLIQATVDDLPDTTTSKEDIASHVNLLHDECERASVELAMLYSEFDNAFAMLRKHVTSYNDPQ